MRFHLVFNMLILLFGFPAQLAADEIAKPKVLSSVEESRWIDAVKNHQTADGATVLQVLQYAEKMRPKKFKVGSIDVGYSGSSGEPEVVGIGYWIGAKRLDGDSFVDLGYGVERDGNNLKIVPGKNENTSDTIDTALEGGRDSFLIYIDKMYEETCIDFDTKAKLC